MPAAFSGLLNDHVSISSSRTPTSNDFHIAGWWRDTMGASAAGARRNYVVTDQTSYGFLCGPVDVGGGYLWTVLSITPSPFTTVNGAQGTHAPVVGKNHYVEFLRRGNTIEMWVDFVRELSYTDTTSFVYDDWAIGGGFGGGTDDVSWGGDVAAVKLWMKAKSRAEMEAESRYYIPLDLGRLYEAWPFFEGGQRGLQGIMVGNGIDGGFTKNLLDLGANVLRPSNWKPPILWSPPRRESVIQTLTTSVGSRPPFFSKPTFRQRRRYV